MSLFDSREDIRRRILQSIKNDGRIVGAVDYGSTSEGRSDAWSDIDIALYISNTEIDAFAAQWKKWADQFGILLLAYIGGVGHPWVIYDAKPMPVRVDFAFHTASAVDNLLSWPNAPLSVEKMVLHDETKAALTRNVQRIVGQSLAPPDLSQAFDQVCGDFWYYMLRTHTKLMRGHQWDARFDFNLTIMGNLFGLLRLESGAVERWRGSSASTDIERVLTETRLAQLERCIPGPGEAELKRVMFEAAVLGTEVSDAIILNNDGWTWPHKLAARVEQVLRSHQ